MKVKLILKPISFSEIKNEITIDIELSSKASLISEEVLKFYPELKKNLDFMHRGKKLILDKTLEEQGVKEGTKLMMYGSEITKQINSSKEEIIINKQTQAKKSLVEMGHQSEIIDSVIKTIPNIDKLTIEEIIEKSLIFLKGLKKESIEEYSIHLDKQDFLIDEDNFTSVFSMGDGIQGQLGIGKYIKSEFPLRVGQLGKIRKIACGVSHSLALTESGQVYFWGRYFMPIASTDNVLNPTDYKTGDYPSPFLIESLELIVEIGCGANHSLALNERGEIFTWGEGLYGQLGHGRLDNEFYPRKVDSLSNLRFKHVTGGATHSIAVTHDNYLFGWGSNEKNQINFKQINKNTISPNLIPLFEMIGNYTLEEIINLNLDDSLTKNNLINFPHSKINVDSIDKELENDFSYNPDDLMKVKFVCCGTWFTVCTSVMFPNTLYLFGNSYKRVIKLNYFEENKLEIKQISASNYNICILTNDNSVYKINVSCLEKGINKLDYIKDTLDIEKIGCGYDYLMILTKDKQAILNRNFEKDKFVLLNSELKTGIKDISTGPSHMFLVSELNDNSIGNYFYNKIVEYVNEYKEDGLYQDMYIKSGSSLDNLNEILFPCHSIFIQQFIQIKSENNSNTPLVIKIDLPNNCILTMLELIYTCNLTSLNSQESIENPEILKTLNLNLKQILVYLTENKLEGENGYNLVNLVSLYCERTKELMNSLKDNGEFHKLLIHKKFNEMTSFISRNLNPGEIRTNNITNQISQNEDEEEENFSNNTRNYFEQFSHKGTKINIMSSKDFDPELDKNTINILDYIKLQNQKMNERDYVNKNINLTRHKLISLQTNYIAYHINDNLCFSFNLKSEKYKINKLVLSFKSHYFNNLIKSSDSDRNHLDLSDDLPSDKMKYIVKFFNNEKYKIPAEEIFEILELTSFLMIDNLVSLLENELEEIICKLLF